MIRDARVLADEFVPREVEHRNDELNELASALRPITEDRPAQSLVVTGPTGTGKTCLTKHTVERLRRVIPQEAVGYQYINCWRDHSRSAVLRRLLGSLSHRDDPSLTSAPIHELMDRLDAYTGPRCVAILDEVDQLADKKVIYDLHSLSQVSMMLIANNAEAVFGTADDRLRSRIAGSRRVHFDRYGLEELVTILETRAYWGLVENAIEQSELRMIADIAAGDARVAISTLRHAAHLAEDCDRERITADVVGDAIPGARDERFETAFDRLTSDQRVLYGIIDEAGEIEPAAVYTAYRERVENPKTDRSVRNYLQKMAQYDLIVAEGEGRGRVYRSRA